MKFLILLVLLTSFIIVDSQYSVYYSDDRYESNATFDCLYAYSGDTALLSTDDYSLIPYCRRLDGTEEEENFSTISYENILNNITFAELYRQGVTSMELLKWSVPIDIIERYEKIGENSTEIFYNCSLPWFGSTCQYRFEPGVELRSFNKVLQFPYDINDKPDLHVFSNTCYPFLPDCYRGPSPMCLDWREICDGYFDCLHGEDEQLCDTLEVNECFEDEFRCHFGGQCIPSAFLRDEKASTDCLDGSDEVHHTKYSRYVTDFLCTLVSKFQCEELNDRRSLVLYPCLGPTSFSLTMETSTKNLIVCNFNRYHYMFFNVFASLDHISNMRCRQAFYCSLKFYTIPYFKYNDTSKTGCELLGDYCQSEWLVLPESPFIYGLFQFVYLTNRSNDEFKLNIAPDFICINASHCPGLVYCSIDIGMHNGLTCCKMNNLTNIRLSSWTLLDDFLFDLRQRCLTIGTHKTCSHSSLFHCSNSSKCISKHRLVDGYNDCYYKEDELFPTCQLNDSKRFICASNPEKCLSLVAIENGIEDCERGDDEWPENRRDIQRNSMPFAIFCDGEKDLLSMDASNNTDETNCAWWPCNNPYSRCDNAWHCLNGADELNCLDTKCLLNEHFCTGHPSKKPLCVPYFHLMEKRLNSETELVRHVYFANQTDVNLKDYFFWNETKCITSEHLIYRPLKASIVHDDDCFIRIKISSPLRYYTLLQEHDSFRCYLASQSEFKRKPKQFLQTFGLNYFPSTSLNSSAPQPSQVNVNISTPMQNVKRDWYCNRGIPLLFKNNQTKKCLCPPSYFGHRCHLQNQRISLTLQLIYRTITDNIHSFQLVIMLIDDQETVYPYHEQITYVPKRDCQKKFNIYLLYPRRPKNLSSNYSIRIDIFNKITLTYWTSWHLAIPFQFLPVNRIATQVFIPPTIAAQQPESSCKLSCGQHGRCMRYDNKNSSYFCQCNQGYSGRQCNYKHSCSCSSDSFCLTSSICLCSMEKFGRNCHLTRPVCQALNNSCENDGLCISTDNRINVSDFMCLCKENFYGKRCENQITNGISIELNEYIIQQVSVLFIHYIKAFDLSEHHQVTELTKIKYGENQIQLRVKEQFHLLFIEPLKRNYYLIIKQESFRKLNHIQMKLSPNQRCVSTDELMNSTLKSYTYLHRIKYYPLLCRQYKQLMCFYDETYMCICDLNRFSNCFIFNHSMTYDCQGQNYCENNGKCFQDNLKCPVQALCICSDCHYGLRCQFTTKGFVLSLDYILSYHIKPNRSFSQQPIIIKISIAIITLMLILGLINGIMSILTFHMKKTRNVGCGYYLLISSSTSICLIIMLTIKFWQLILSQMTILTNRAFLDMNCLLLDVTIKVLIAFNDWLNTCVSIEQAVNIRRGVRFNKTKSRQMSKWVMLSILTVTILTHLHDPFHRQLIDDIDIDEKRIWCIVQYSSSISTWNSFITFIHFLMPFLINLLGIIFTIISIARSRSNLQGRLPFIDHLRLQLKQQRSRLVASFVFILLALVRLVTSFTNGCMKSPNNSWLFLFAYLVPFLPSMMTFIVYILPSKVYKEQFNISVQQKIRRIRTLF
ncbi:unnamed protein product [Adineta steineri]|uniref:Uncharacterized protein n=1 Tax=Adineta steineri TaxID=433720 RepID=A0A814XZW4_9BILA|nr:unnamed protein product [Adineta steineri]CAF4021519.1 unnamed protein product [Adineta steineri]